MLFSIATICCALESGGFRLLILSDLLVTGVVLVVRAATLGREVTLLCASHVGQNFAMCPCWQQRKHQPSAESFFRSSSVSFFRGGTGMRDVVVASTSIAWGIGTLVLLIVATRPLWIVLIMRGKAHILDFSEAFCLFPCCLFPAIHIGRPGFVE